MAWFRLEGRGAFHQKVIAAGDEAYGAWVRAGQWSCDQLTDGHVPKATALLINRKPKVWARLVEVRLLHETEDGYEIHDFLDWNPSSDQERARREETREKRRAAGKIGGKRSGEVRRGEAEPKQVASDDAKQTGSKDEANAKQSASVLLEANGKQNEAPSPSPSPSPIPSTEEDPPTPRGAGEAGRSLPLVLEPLSVAPAPKKRREGLSPSEQAYSDAYVAGQEAAEPGCGFRPLTSAACRLVGAAAQTHAKDRFRQRITGDALLAWIRETSAEFRRAAEPQYAQGYSAHAFGAWLDAGRPMTRREPLPEPSRIIIPERAPPPPKNRRMTADEQARFHAEILSLKPQEDADGNRHADHEA